MANPNPIGFSGKAGPGRPPGLPNKATQEFRVALNNLLEHVAPKMVEWLEKVAEKDPARALDLMSKLAEYIHPKLSRAEVTGLGGSAIQQEINVTDSGRSKFRQLLGKK